MSSITEPLFSICFTSFFLPPLQDKWWTVKQAAKRRLADKILELTGVKVSPDALFDIQVRDDSTPSLFFFIVLLILIIHIQQD
jgi:hypothetical protein